jgi:hypothetical protein
MSSIFISLREWEHDTLVIHQCFCYCWTPKCVWKRNSFLAPWLFIHQSFCYHWTSKGVWKRKLFWPLPLAIVVSSSQDLSVATRFYQGQDPGFRRRLRFLVYPFYGQDPGLRRRLRFRVYYYQTKVKTQPVGLAWPQVVVQSLSRTLDTQDKDRNLCSLTQVFEAWQLMHVVNFFIWRWIKVIRIRTRSRTLDRQDKDRNLCPVSCLNFYLAYLQLVYGVQRTICGHSWTTSRPRTRVTGWQEWWRLRLHSCKTPSH